MRRLISCMNLNERQVYRTLMTLLFLAKWGTPVKGFKISC